MTLSLCFDGPGDHRDLHVLTHSFTTRRSSDLPTPLLQREGNDLLPEYPTARDGSVAGRRFRNNRLRKATLAVGCRARQLPTNSCRPRGTWPMARCVGSPRPPSPGAYLSNQPRPGSPRRAGPRDLPIRTPPRRPRAAPPAHLPVLP